MRGTHHVGTSRRPFTQPTCGGSGKAIRVHSGHKVNASVVDKQSQHEVFVIVATQQLSQVEQHHSTDDFITMHVTHVLHLWLTY